MLTRLFSPKKGIHFPAISALGMSSPCRSHFDHLNRTLNRTALDDPRILSGPFWAELRVFLAVAKSKSFNRAADELGISQPTVSRHVHRLQDLMGCQLLSSSNSGIVLTERGNELAKTLLDLDDRLFKLSRQLRAETRAAEGLVHISATEALAGLFIVPNIPAFNEQYPNIRLHLKNPMNLVKFRENQADIALRFALPAEKGIEVQAVGYVHLIPVATHSYLSRYGVPTGTIWKTTVSSTPTITRRAPRFGAAGARPWTGVTLRTSATIPMPMPSWSKAGLVSG